jgi:hypothetical protein
MPCNEPGQYSIRIKTSYTPSEALFQAASIRWTMFGWPFRIRFGQLVRGTKTRLTTVTYHDVNLLLNLGKHRLVWNCDTFKNMVCCSVHGRRRPDEVDMCESAYKGNVTKVDRNENERRTLAKVSLYLDSITVYGYFLTWDQGTLVAGLLEGHMVLVLCLYSAESTAR